MRKGTATGLVVVLPCLWVTGASAAYCFLTDQWAMFVFPYLQWLQAAPWWQLNGWMTIYVVGSAAAPTLVVAMLAYAAWKASGRRQRRRQRRPLVWGETGFASQSDMQRGGVNITKDPFAP